LYHLVNPTVNLLDPVENYITEELPEIPSGEEDGENSLLNSQPDTHLDTGMFNTGNDET